MRFFPPGNLLNNTSGYTEKYTGLGEYYIVLYFLGKKGGTIPNYYMGSQKKAIIAWGYKGGLLLCESTKGDITTYRGSIPIGDQWEALMCREHKRRHYYYIGAQKGTNVLLCWGVITEWLTKKSTINVWGLTLIFKTFLVLH